MGAASGIDTIGFAGAAAGAGASGAGADSTAGGAATSAGAAAVSAVGAGAGASTGATVASTLTVNTRNYKKTTAYATQTDSIHNHYLVLTYLL